MAPRSRERWRDLPDRRLARPRFNAGKHRDEEIDVEGLWSAVNGRAAIVLSGHDHNLQRPSDRRHHQNVTGAGGLARHAVEEEDPRMAFSEDSTVGGLRIVLGRGRADLKFIAADGRCSTAARAAAGAESAPLRRYAR